MRKISRYYFLLRTFLIRSGYKRAAWLKKRNYFKQQGDHCYFQIFNFGTEPYLLSFGDNVHVATGVLFVSHDITAQMFNYMQDGTKYVNRRGPINIGNNVFIGANTTLLYDISIGDNVIIGAGSLVNKNIPSGVVAAGNPCKVIGSFEDYRNRIANTV